MIAIIDYGAGNIFSVKNALDYLGVERSAMSAELGKLTKLGILQTQRSHFTLLKPLD